MKLQRIDLLTLSLLATASLASRLPLRSVYLFHWDSLNFAASLAHYDVRMHQPHPPGYVLYSLLGKLVLPIAGEANASFVWISLAGGVLGVCAIYLLGLIIAGRPTAFVAALLTVSSPLHWFYSVIALTYALEFLLVTAVAVLCYVQLSGNHRIWLWSAALLGLIGGVRQNDVVFLLPLWLCSVVPLSWPRRLGSLAVLSGVVLAWTLPMAKLSGGVNGYLASVGAQSAALAGESSFAVASQLVLNGGRMAIYLVYGLLLGAVALAAGTILALRRVRALIRDRRTWFFALWILPSVSFYLLFHIRQHGHIFTFLPAVVILTAMSVVAIGKSVARNGVQQPVFQITSVLVLTNLAFFLLAPASLFGSNRLPLQAPVRTALVERDHHLGERFAAIQARFQPATTAIIAGGIDYYHPTYYLAGYQQIRVDSQQELRPIALQDGVTTLVWFDDVSWAATGKLISDVSELHLPSGAVLHYVTWSPDQRAILSPNGVVIASR